MSVSNIIGKSTEHGKKLAQSLGMVCILACTQLSVADTIDCVQKKTGLSCSFKGKKSFIPNGKGATISDCEISVGKRGDINSMCENTSISITGSGKINQSNTNGTSIIVIK